MEAMRKRGTRTTSLGAAAALLTVAIALVTAWAPILETYYHHQLQTGGESERIDAVEGLVRLDRLGSMPRLLEAFESDPSEAVRKATLRALATVRLGEHEERVFQAVRAVSKNRRLQDRLRAAISKQTRFRFPGVRSESQRLSQ